MKKHIIYYNDAELDALKYCAKVMDFGVSLTLTAALNELLNAFLMIRDNRNIYKQQVKFLANQAEKSASLQKATIMCAMRHRKFYDDYSDKVIDLAENDIDNFRNSIIDLLKKNNHTDCELIAQCEVARVLLVLAKQHYDTTLQATKDKFKCRMPDTFPEFNCISVLGSWNKLCGILFKNRPSTDLNTNEIKHQFDVLAKGFSNGAYVDECKKEAMMLNPDFKENDVEVKENKQ